MKELFLTIYGRVQGVSFRYHAREKAIELDISGWVKNESNGTVVITAQGQRANLEQFLIWCTVGQGEAKVEKLVPVWSKPNNLYHSFEIRS